MLQNDDTVLKNRNKESSIELSNTTHSPAQKEMINDQKQTVAELKKHEAFFSQIPDIAYICDTKGNILFLNQTFEKLTGRKQDDFLGKPFAPLFDEINLKKALDVYTRSLKGEISQCVLNFKDTGVFCEYKNLPLKDIADTVAGVVCIIREITEQRRSDAMLVEQMRLTGFARDIGISLTKNETLGETLHGCMEAMVRNLNAALARIWTLNEQENTLELQASSGIYTHIDGKHSRIPMGAFKVGLIAQERKPHLTNSVVGDPKVHDQEWAKQMGMVAFAGYPLIIDDRLVGVMAMFARKPLTKTTLVALASVADSIALGIEHKKMDAALRKYESLFSEISDFAYICDSKGNILFANKMFETLTVHKPGELAGKPFVSLFGEEDQKLAIDAYTRALKGESSRGELCFKDSGILCEHKNTPLKGEKGKVVGFAGIARNVTESRRLEQNLREIKSRFEFLLWVSPVMIYSANYGDYRTTFISDNVRLQLGYEPGQFMQDLKFWYDHIHPEDLPRVLGEISRIPEVDHMVLEYRFLHRNGNYLTMYDELNVVRDESGKPLEIIGCWMDITRRRQMEEEYKKLHEHLCNMQKLESIVTLASCLAHEINNPLTGVINCAQLLLDKSPEGDENREIITIIIKEGKRIANMVGRLLSISRAGSENEKMTQVDIKDLLSNAFALITSQLQREGIKIKLNIPNQLPKIVARPLQTKLVFLNIINNAIYALNQKYPGTHDDKILEITCDETTVDNLPCVKVRFCDHGIGMKEDIINEVFKPLSTTKPKGKGSGLGLSICNNIIREYKGKLEISSLWGEYTTVAVILPVHTLKEFSD